MILGKIVKILEILKSHYKVGDEDVSITQHTKYEKKHPQQPLKTLFGSHLTVTCFIPLKACSERFLSVYYTVIGWEIFLYPKIFYYSAVKVTLYRVTLL